MLMSNEVGAQPGGALKAINDQGGRNSPDGKKIFSTLSQGSSIQVGDVTGVVKISSDVIHADSQAGLAGLDQYANREAAKASIAGLSKQMKILVPELFTQEYLQIAAMSSGKSVDTIKAMFVRMEDISSVEEILEKMNEFYSEVSERARVVLQNFADVGAAAKLNTAMQAAGYSVHDNDPVSVITANSKAFFKDILAEQGMVVQGKVVSWKPEEWNMQKMLEITQAAMELTQRSGGYVLKLPLSYSGQGVLVVRKDANQPIQVKNEAGEVIKTYTNLMDYLMQEISPRKDGITEIVLDELLPMDDELGPSSSFWIHPDGSYEYMGSTNQILKGGVHKGNYMLESEEYKQDWQEVIDGMQKLTPAIVNHIQSGLTEKGMKPYIGKGNIDFALLDLDKVSEQKLKELGCTSYEVVNLKGKAYVLYPVEANIRKGGACHAVLQAISNDIHKTFGDVGAVSVENITVPNNFIKSMSGNTYPQKVQQAKSKLFTYMLDNGMVANADSATTGINSAPFIDGGDKRDSKIVVVGSYASKQQEKSIKVDLKQALKV